MAGNFGAAAAAVGLAVFVSAIITAATAWIKVEVRRGQHTKLSVWDSGAGSSKAFVGMLLASSIISFLFTIAGTAKGLELGHTISLAFHCLTAFFALIAFTTYMSDWQQVVNTELFDHGYGAGFAFCIITMCLAVVGAFASLAAKIEVQGGEASTDKGGSYGSGSAQENPSDVAKA